VFELKNYITEVVGILMFLQIGGKFVKAEQYGEEVEEEEELILSQVYEHRVKIKGQCLEIIHPVLGYHAKLPTAIAFVFLVLIH
jgi:hypothetical protein